MRLFWAVDGVVVVHKCSASGDCGGGELNRWLGREAEQEEEVESHPGEAEFVLSRFYCRAPLPPPPPAPPLPGHWGCSGVNQGREG